MVDPALSHLDPPADPRAAWDLPPFGGMEVVSHIDPRVTRILAPNPSPMTLDGTNTYVIGEAGTGEVVIVDPGPEEPAHLERAEEVLADRDATCALVLVTHHHRDHAAAASAWAERFDSPLAAPSPEVAGSAGTVVGDGWSERIAGVGIRAVATPGHCGDHTAYRLDHGPLLSGDHILGRGTSVVAHPDGDLAAYLESLRRVLDIDTDALLPGHGPVLREDPTAVIRFYLDHRRFRQRQVLTLLEEGPKHATEIVRRIYAEVDPAVLPAAAASTRATLEKLADDGAVRVDEGGTATLVA